MSIQRKIHENQSGQTLLLALLAIIVLLLAALFLFDLQGIIRVKVKSQNAADAAALAGARMQMEGLNLIGEINLIKACSVLISDFSLDSTADEITAASDNLTEMQARISFVAPILGIGAGQQAAKNNGMVDPSEIYDTAVFREFSLTSYINTVMDDDVYGTDDYQQVIQGYEWRTPYVDMLNIINTQGIAAGPSMVTPDVDSMFTLDLINAVLYDFWCHHTLRALLRAGDSYFADRWWQGLVSGVSFVEQSELLPLHVQYTSNDTSGMTYDAAVENAMDYLLDLADDRGLELGMITQMPYMKWSTYNNYWSNAPGEGWAEDSSLLYLRRGLRHEYLYGGAATKMTCMIPGGEDSKFQWLTGSFQVHDIKRGEGVISQQSSVAPTVRSSALAKPLGHLETQTERLPPNEVEMILPVFHSVRLIPVSMMNITSIYDEDFLFYKFLKWLEGVDDINSPSTPPPAGTGNYLYAIQKLNNPLWRHSGYNPSFVYTPPGEVPTYDPLSDTGAGVLQRPVPNPGSSESPNDGYARDDDDNIIGISYTYENRCDWHPGGGPGGRGGGGPGALH